MSELKPKSREEYMQDLYEIICNAAHLSIVIARSPDIFYFTPARPGDCYSEEDHSMIDYAYYLSSRTAMIARTTAGSVERSQVAPLVKFALRPGLHRYKQGDGKRGGSRNGYRIYEMHKAGVACYVDVRDRGADEGQKEGIVEYVARVKSEVAAKKLTEASGAP